MKGHRLNKRQPLSEAIKQQEKLYNKYQEYSLKTTEELKEMYKYLGGGYREACAQILLQRYKDGLKDQQTEELPEGEA